MKCLQILLERGAVVTADKAGITPLQLCAQVNLSLSSLSPFLSPLSSPSLPPSSSIDQTVFSSQSGYCECAELILQFYPKKVDHVIQLVMQETVPESKMLALLQYLCHASKDLLTRITSHLAERTTTAGQELLRLGIPMCINNNSHKNVCTHMHIYVTMQSGISYILSSELSSR